MSVLSSKYGSELHLLRYLGRHRKDFDRRILAETGGDSIDWEDFRFETKSKHSFDTELKGLEFLGPDAQVQGAWAAFWPQGRGIQCWDAVGRVFRDGRPEWLLVEAKAHLAEIHCDCKAKTGRGRRMIAAALDHVKESLGVDPKADWLSNYYQFSNRVAALHFLHEHGIPTRLLFVYFYGDRNGRGRDCPAVAEDWYEELQHLDRHVGLPPSHALASRIHKLFVPVRRRE